MKAFAKNYVKSMRLYYCFVTLTAGWAGMAMYGGGIALREKVVLSIFLFLSWGVNQIINDYLNIREDRINAPDRPMASGALKALPALLASGTAIAALILYSAVMSPASLIPLCAGVALNIAYSRTKLILFFGLSISCCAWYASAFLEHDALTMFTDEKNLAMWLALIVFNMAMTFYTTFKDAKGDRNAGKLTTPVKYGAKAAGKIGLIIGFAPALVLLSIGLMFRSDASNMPYVATAATAGLMFMLTGVLFYKNPKGKKTYGNLKYDFAALCAAQSAITALSMPLEGAVLCAASVAAVLIIFKWGYKNAAE